MTEAVSPGRQGAPGSALARPIEASSAVISLFLILCAIGIAISPVWLGGYALTTATEILIAALFGLGLHLLVGYCGMVSLGHAMFFGLGGYGLAIGTMILHVPLWISSLITLLLVGVAGLVVGAICTRTRGVQFLLITLAFSQMVYGAAVKLPLTNRSDGLTGVPRPDLSFLGLGSDNPAVFYAYALIVFLVAMVLVWQIVRSPFGTVLIGIRENEQRALAMGYNVRRYKIAAFALSGVLTAIAGILQAEYTYFISPDAMTWQFSGEGVLMVIIGGVGYMFGPLAGAAAFVLVKQQLSNLTAEYILFFGIFFMVVVAFFRGGILGAVNSLRERFLT
jgi:branched-chain amino acid transport system permease protein